MDTIARRERLDLRLPADKKQTIEQAAALSGQTVSNFILSTTVRQARKVIRESASIELSNRDRDRFLAALDDADAKPNAALLRAAGRYKTASG